MLNLLGKVRLDKVYLSSNYKDCHNVKVFYQGPLKLTFAKKQTVNIERNCSKRIRTKKLPIVMLVKLTPGVNFTNILRAAFTLVGPKSAK